ncbi:MAG: UbiA family prenyltransferase [Gemmatimonadaceae bacterium]|nr:UbiA family prenyltransferase [Gemmatimonadaceae bacterium]
MTTPAIASDAVVARPLWRDLVMLTKPTIISLLLVTTAAPMYIAGRPSLTLLAIVMFGGYLMAGGANAVNMYLDRDIDDVMTRTRLRPIPSGRMHAARRALVRHRTGRRRATWLLAFYVNVLTAALALGGLLLLRLHLHPLAQAHHAAEHRDRWRGGRLPAARGLGGRDGSHRPHGDLPLPHRLLLDAAALLGARAQQAEGLRQRQGADGPARSGASARRCAQMFWYTIVLLVVTLLPVTYGAFGWIYGISATLFGGLLLGGVVKMMRATDWVKPAWWVYGYSLLYLALLFVAMVVDRQVSL